MYHSNTLRSDIEKSFKLKKIPLVVSGVGILLIFQPGKSNETDVLVPVERKELFQKDLNLD